MFIYKKADVISDAENIMVSENHDTAETEAHTHEFIELVYTSDGKAKHYIDGNEYEATRGYLLFISYGQSHRFVPDPETTFYNILLTPEFLSGELINAESINVLFAHSMFSEFSEMGEYNSQSIFFEGKEMFEIEEIIHKMANEYDKKNIGYKSILHGYMQIVFAKLLRKLYGINSSEAKEFLPEIISYIDENIANKISLSNIAAKSFYNPAYFSRLLKEHFGKSFSAYVKERRIEHAAKMLGDTNKTVEEIMAQSGYSDKKLFYKHFKEVYKTSPGQYRKKA